MMLYHTEYSDNPPQVVRLLKGYVVWRIGPEFRSMQ
jgi:hypothetical protein